jgi:hypothetical protein
MPGNTCFEMRKQQFALSFDFFENQIQALIVCFVVFGVGIFCATRQPPTAFYVSCNLFPRLGTLGGIFVMGA